MADTKQRRSRTPLSRRQALAMMGAASGALIAGKRSAAAQSPAVRKKVKLLYWNWADNPNHLKITTDAVAGFNKAQELIEVEVDANMATQESRKKLVVAYAAGAAPDVCNLIQYWAQDYLDSGILFPVEDYFNKWDAKADFFPNIMEQVRSKPKQPILYIPQTSIPFFMIYRADWLKEAGLPVPDTYEQFISTCKAISKPPERYGHAIRGQGYSGVQVITPVWHSAGVTFADDKGGSDFDSPAAIDVTRKWVDMLLKDHSAQPTAVNDGYREIFALMEKSKTGFWFYGPHASPQLMTALGDKIKAAPYPRVGDKKYMLANTEGPMIVSTCKEKDAAWELVKWLTSGDVALSFTKTRSVPPVRYSLAKNEFFQNNQFIKMSLDHTDQWWIPPYDNPNWANFQDKIAPFWQETLSGKLSAEGFNKQGAKFLRGGA
jgi:multiple sugar transport system substrate-binding protein